MFIASYVVVLHVNMLTHSLDLLYQPVEQSHSTGLKAVPESYSACADCPKFLTTEQEGVKCH